MAAFLKSPIAYLSLVLGCLFVFWLIQGRFGCQTARQENREERQERRSHKSVVVNNAKALSGATILIPGGRKWQADKLVNLRGIEVPFIVDDDSRANLERLMAFPLTLTYQIHGLFFATDDPKAYEAMEAKSTEPIVGVVFDSANRNLAVEQLRAGMAVTNEDSTKEMRAAESEAKRKHAGVWAR